MPSFASRLSTRDIVETTIRNHPRDCIFAPNAVDNVVAALLHATDEESFLNICVAALKENEIYCPHEGIDRRHLYSVAEGGTRVEHA